MAASFNQILLMQPEGDTMEIMDLHKPEFETMIKYYSLQYMENTIVLL
jgi:hypothetical protein